MRLVATYLIGVAIGLVLLGLWQQARQRGQSAQPSGEAQQAPAPAPAEAPPPGPAGAP